MTSIHTWSTTASENDDADGSINWMELMDPDQVNNSARQMMGRVAEWRNDISIARLSTGAADAYQVTVASTPAALVDGMMFSVLPHQVNVGASTLKINSFGAKPLRAKTATNLQPGDIQTGVPFLAMYNAAADEFLILNSGHFANALFPSLVSTYSLNALIPVGAVIAWPTATVPAGWLEANGASLSTTEYPALFAKYGYTYGGAGASFNIPDYRGEFLRGFDNAVGRDPDRASRTNRGDGTTGDAVGTKQADQTDSHTHTATTSTTITSGGTHTHSLTGYFSSASAGSGYPGRTGTGDAAPTITSTNSGGSHTHAAASTTTVTATGGNETRPRNVNVMYIIFAKPSAALAEMQGLTGLPYVFDEGTTAVDPGAGRLAWNNAAPASATELYVSETGPNAEAFAPILATWDDIGTTTRGYLYITKVGTPTTFAYFSVESAETDAGTWKQWTITGIASGGTFADGDNLNVIFAPVGSGPQGIQGEPGVSGGLYFNFDSSTTTAADPGTGDLRLNNAALDSVTELSISYTGSATGDPNYETTIKTWDDSTTTTNRGHLTIKKVSAPQNFASYRVTSAITDGTTYGRFTIAHQGSNGSFSDADACVVEFVRSGDQGASGAGTGDLLAANNLSDVDNPSVALGNIGAAAVSHAHAASAITSGTLVHERGGLEADVSAYSGLVHITGGTTSAIEAASQAEMEAGTETALRGMSPIRVKQAIDALAGASTALDRNYITNPGMRISQQNGTSSGTASGYYAVDEWNHVHSQDGTLTAAQVAVVSPGGSTHRYRMTVTGNDTSIAAGQYAILRQRLEGAQVADFLFGTANARNMVVRFGIKWPAGTYTVSLQNAAADRSYVREFTATGADQVVTVTFPGDTSGTWPTGAVHGMTLIFAYAVGSTFQTTKDAWQAGNYFGTSSSANGLATAAAVFETFDVGAYLDLSSTGVAPDFVLPSVETDRKSCQRYYFSVPAGPTLNISFFASGVIASLAIFHPETMRTIPALTLVSSGAVLTGMTITAYDGPTLSSARLIFLSTEITGNASVAWASGNKFIGNSRM